MICVSIKNEPLFRSLTLFHATLTDAKVGEFDLAKSVSFLLVGDFRQISPLPASCQVQSARMASVNNPPREIFTRVVYHERNRNAGEMWHFN